MDWFGKLRNIKAESELTTREISTISGIPEPTLEKLFSGQTKNPGINTVRQVLHSLGHTLDDIDDLPTKQSPSVSLRAQRVAIAFDKADERDQRIVETTLEPYMDEMAARGSETEAEAKLA